ncbi:MAG: hypothetical protein JO067_14940 [Cupriavidus sp.]|nr:hypothetical protein [Cupriavidus sp.]
MTDKENCWKLVPLKRSYDMRSRAILAFNTATANGADRDDALQAAWEAEFHAAPAPSAQSGPDTDTEIEALFEGRAENTAAISAQSAVNSEVGQ